MTSESSIQVAVRLAASERGYTLWRNNVGLGWTGDWRRQPDGSILIRNPRPLHAGLCEGSSDLVGFLPVVITPEKVGRTVAVFTAIEVKSARGRPSVPQRNFLDVVSTNGGVATVAHSVEDLPWPQ